MIADAKGSATAMSVVHRDRGAIQDGDVVARPRREIGLSSCSSDNNISSSSNSGCYWSNSRDKRRQSSVRFGPWGPRLGEWNESKVLSLVF